MGDFHDSAHTRRRWDPRFAAQEQTKGHEEVRGNAKIDLGWGRLLFAHTFGSADALVDELRHEGEERRDIAMYIADPHVVLSMAPQELFLDPSHTFRLWLAQYRPARMRPSGFVIRRLRTKGDAEEINRIYSQHGMKQAPPDFMWRTRKSRSISYVIAEDEKSGEVIGTATGIDHVHVFDDPEQGSSLWCLAVDPTCPHPGVGEALVRQLAEHYAARGRAFMDLSVMHDNAQAIALYEKLGFMRLQTFAVKTKNPFNEKLFAGPPVDAKMNPYAEIIINEARRRGIQVDIEDEEGGFFRLTSGGRSIACREALCQLTDAVALSRCDDKAVTRRLLERAGLSVPDQIVADDAGRQKAFLDTHGSIVVKPARGEQGRGISVDVRDEAVMRDAIERARAHCDVVLLEQYVSGEDLRIIVIGDEVVAAAVRRPPQIVGTGRHSVKNLIERQSRRRSAATDGESTIPLDDETVRAVESSGFALDGVPEKGVAITVRKTANLHTGGTIHDVTPELHPVLREAARTAAKILDIPVVGFDFLVEDHTQSDYVIIEANERPGLANHEPQPTAERFIDLLFPKSVAPHRRTRRTED